MPKVRVKGTRQQEREFSPGAINPIYEEWNVELPQIGPDDAFKDIVRKLSIYFANTIELPSNFEQLRTTSAGIGLRVLVDHLSKTCTNPAIVNGLLALRWHYAAEREHRGLSEARANACEIVAWRFLSRQSERDAVDFCLHEIPGKDALDANPVAVPPYSNYDVEAAAGDERSPLLARAGEYIPVTHNGKGTGDLRSATRMAELQQAIPKLTLSSDATGEDPRADGFKDQTATFKNLNALEIAVIADAKRFLSQHIVQKIITSIWHGEIVFWDSVSAYSTKKPRYYNVHTADPYSRLRVPKYLKAWEVAFFMTFLALYYSVVVERSFVHLPVVEIVFYFWLVAFLWDEFQEWMDAGVFYMSDIWNLFDMAMITIGLIFAILRVFALSYGSDKINDIAFDVLSLEALLVVPRICSFLSLSPYWGTLIPCLKEMGKDFIKFMILVIIIYLGFLTTFSLMARDTFSLSEMTWDITEIFYGNTGIGFQIMKKIDRNFGPPLMIVFITLSSILLTGSLTGMLSNSFGRVMAQAKEEYLYFYSVYVLEASTSTRLTHFYPPFNLIALVFFRPWQIIFTKDDRFRHGRVFALKATHFPLVAIIYAYEWFWRKVSDIKEKDGWGQGGGDWASFTGGRTRSNSEAPRRIGAPSNAAHRRRRLDSDAIMRRYQGQLSPDGRSSMGVGARPPSASRSLWSVTSDDEGEQGPSNAELLKKIDQLTAIVMAMRDQQQQQLR